jgi:hypothetical protein
MFFLSMESRVCIDIRIEISSKQVTDLSRCFNLILKMNKTCSGVTNGSSTH